MFTYAEANGQSAFDRQVSLAARPTPFGQAVSAYALNAFDRNFTTQIFQALDDRGILFGGVQEADNLTEEQFRESEHFREGVEWDEAMTEERAATIAERFDRRRYRDRLMRNSDSAIAAIAGSLAGAAADPINYVPIFGQVARTAAMMRMGAIRGGAVIAGAEAAAVTAATAPITSHLIGQQGENYGPSEIVGDIVLSAIAGGAFGAAGGFLASHRAKAAVGRSVGAPALGEAVDELARVADEIDDGVEPTASGKRPEFAGTIQEEGRSELLAGLVEEAGIDTSGPLPRLDGVQPEPIARDVAERAEASLKGTEDEFGYDIETGADPRFDEASAVLADLPEHRRARASADLEAADAEFATARQEADVADALVSCTLRFGA